MISRFFILISILADRLLNWRIKQLYSKRVVLALRTKSIESDRSVTIHQIRVVEKKAKDKINALVDKKINAVRRKSGKKIGALINKSKLLKNEISELNRRKDKDE